MKKWLLISFVVCIILIGFVYLFIPTTITISRTSIINCTESGASRYITGKDKWIKWWPGINNDSNVTAVKNGLFKQGIYTYQFTKKFYNTTGILIQSNDLNLNSTINIIPLQSDTIAVQWRCIVLTGNNPLTKVQNYLQAEAVKKSMDSILYTLNQFLSNTENVYTTDIEQVRVKDTLLIGIRKGFKAYPSTEDIYGLLKPISTYLTSVNIKQSGYPMLNIKKQDSGYFETMVVIPINSEPPANDNFFIKRMTPGKILVSGEIRGGAYTAGLAFEELENYVHDYHRISPAIPFQSLITDRSAEPDTTKWITKIYYPVF